MSQDLIERLCYRAKYATDSRREDIRLHLEAAKRIEQLEAQLAAPADLLRRLLADHQRVEPHHADQCALCREATAAIEGQSAPKVAPNSMLVTMFCKAADNLADMPISRGWAASWAKEAHALLEANDYFRTQPAQSNSHQIAVKQGERQPESQVGNFGDSGEEQLRRRVENLPLPDYTQGERQPDFRRPTSTACVVRPTETARGPQYGDDA